MLPVILTRIVNLIQTATLALTLTLTLVLYPPERLNIPVGLTYDTQVKGSL